MKRMNPGRAVVSGIGIWNLEFVWDLVLGILVSRAPNLL
jgi:hypothetical protein